jgi:hypothetical protein
MLSGPEVLLAQTQGCNVIIHEIIYLQFKKLAGRF